MGAIVCIAFGSQPQPWHDTPSDFHKCVRETKEVLAGGGIVAVPTDTIYGIISLLGSWPKVLEAKRRPDDKALGLFLEKVEDIPK